MLQADRLCVHLGVVRVRWVHDLSSIDAHATDGTGRFMPVRAHRTLGLSTCLPLCVYVCVRARVCACVLMCLAELMTT